jgi:putative cardiolipin synthase
MRCRPGLALVVTALWLLVACAGRLPEVERTPSLALVDPASTTLGREVAALAPQRSDFSGIHLLGDPRRAFATYLGLAAQAERSLDAQYYTLHNDTAGWLMIEALLQAAERGVRVRLLLDDLHTVGLDRALVSLDAHPAIEVRLFNPFPARYMRLVDLVRDFDGSNRRMHNKSFIADNAAAIMGGRNVGDAYFGLAGDANFADLDLLAVGPVVQDVSAQFDRYWNSPWAFPASAIIEPFVPPGKGYLARRISNRTESELARDYVTGLDPAVIVAPLRHLPLAWSPVRLIVDPPEKVAGDTVADGDQMITRLMQAMGTPEERLDIVSAYLVMRRPWIDILGDWVDQGVKVRILTNSLAGIDVPLAHAGHLMRRRPLLLAGVEVWEMKADGDDPGFGEPAPLGPAPTLHGKAAAVDGKRLFVGSLNLDQRSAYLNTEMGVIIENPELATQLHRLFDERLADHAYRVVIGEKSRLVWIETTPEGEIRYDREPQAGFWRWIGAGVAALLPIDWLL